MPSFFWREEIGAILNFGGKIAIRVICMAIYGDAVASISSPHEDA